MLSQKRLLKAIDDDLRVCEAAAKNLATDTPGKKRNLKEHEAFVKHRDWALQADSHQDQLEKIISSLETSELLSGYERWRERSEELKILGT